MTEPSYQEQAVEAAAKAAHRRSWEVSPQITARWSESSWSKVADADVRAHFRSLVRPAVAAAEPLIRADEREKLREALLHPFLVQAVALECGRLPADPQTGPSDEALSHVEAEVRQELERALSLSQLDEESTR
jgi:hypothetical protein